MEETEQKFQDIRNYVVHHFGLDQGTRSITETEIEGVAGPMRPDLILDDGQRRYYIEVAPKSGINKISQLSLYRELLKAEGLYRPDDRFILLYKTISNRIEAVAEKIGITTVRAPFDLKLSGFEKSDISSKVKLTTEKSWAVIYALIRHGPASIKQMSKDTGVSYGWTHKVITGLMDTGLAAKEFDQVKITDLNKLFNGIAWERPFERMKIAEAWVGYETAYSAAREISDNLKAHNVRFAFNGPTAGGLYTGRVIRHDTAYLYLEKEHVESFMDAFSTTTGKGIKIKVYAPDRDVFTKSRDVESVTITSPEQTLLDLAGTGYGNMELTKAMAEYHEAQ
jgi:hypothetical protein